MADVSSGVVVDVEAVQELAGACSVAAGRVEDACRAVARAVTGGVRLETEVGLACTAGMGAAFRLGGLGLALGRAAAAYELVEAANARTFAEVDREVAGLCGWLAAAYGDGPGPATVSPPVPLGSRPGFGGVADLVEVLEGVEADDATAPAGRVDVWAVGEPPSYVVALPGTSSWAPPWADSDSADVRSLEADVSLLAGASTAELEALPAALAAAGVPAGARLVLVGHSQGGLTAVRAAGDERLAGRYQITHVVTAGAPIAGIPVPAGVRVLSLERRGDVVPLLDGHPNRATADHVTIRFSTAGAVASPSGLHSVPGYVQGAREADELSDRREQEPALAAWRDSLVEAGIVGAAGPVTGTRVVLALPGRSP